MIGKFIGLKSPLYYVIYLLLVWSVYRSFIRLPEGLDEAIVKPLIWLLPIFYLLKNRRINFTYLGISTKNIFPSLYLAIALGAGFAIEGLIVNIIKYKGIYFSDNLSVFSFIYLLTLSFITAFTEEITFRGYIFNKFWKILGKELNANLISSFFWALIHLPIAVFVLNLNNTSLFIYFMLLLMFGVGSAFIFARTKNIFSSILLHIFWNWPIILFR